MLKLYLVWFGLYICPTKPKPICRGLGKRKSNLPYYFLFLSYGLNTEFEHRGVNTGGCHWWLKRIGAELCSDLCSREKKKQLRFIS